MSGREVRDYTNLSDPKDRKWGKGKDKIDDEDITFQRMVAKMKEVSGERGGYLHGRGALDSDDSIYLKEQMEAEEDAERLLRHTEKRAFAAFKRAANLADSSPALLPLSLRVEPKPKTGIRQHDLLRNVLEIKRKRPRISSPSSETKGDQKDLLSSNSTAAPLRNGKAESSLTEDQRSLRSKEGTEEKLENAKDRGSSKSSTGITEPENASKTLLGLDYENSDED